MTGRTWPRAVALAVAAALMATSAALAQTTTIKVDGEIIKGYIAKMAAPEAQGRRTLTPGYEKTAEWAAAKFQEWGLKPAGDNGTYFQAVPVRNEFSFATGIPELTVDGRTFYLRDNDFAVDASSTPGAKIDGEVVFVGYGISAPAKGLDEYAGIDVTGKIVLVLKGTPKDANEPRASFLPPGPRPEAPAEAWTDESTDQAKIAAAYAKGAAGILIYNPDRTATANPFGGMGGGRGRAASTATYTRPFVIVSNVDERVFKQVMMRDPQESVRGFNARIDRLRWTIRNKKPQSAATGVKAHLKGYDEVTAYSEKNKNNVSRNVIAKLEGTDPVLKNQYVVVGGHLDHNGMTNGVVYNGADDDASGAATVMEIGRLLAANKVKTKRTLIFALWCGEELGLLGSNYWTSKPSDGVSMDRVVADFNNDMVGLGDKIGAPGAENFPTIWEVIKRDQSKAIMDIVAETNPTGAGGSDYSGFITQGIEALALMTVDPAGHPDYHDAGDDVEKISADILGKNAQFVLQGMISVANETKVNLLIPDRQHLFNGLLMNVPSMKAGARGAWETMKVTSHQDLATQVTARAKELVAASRPAAFGAAAAPAAAAAPRRGAGQALRVAKGIGDLSAFGGSVPFLTLAATVLEFGRVDITKEDGVWVKDGLTQDGKAAVKALEAAGVIVHLVKPSAKLLADMLEASEKPFAMSGLTDIDAATAAKMNAKNDVLILEFNGADVAGTVARVQAARKVFGDADNLMIAATGDITDKAKQDFYLALVKNGWTKDEIYAMTGAGANNRPGGVLLKLGYSAPAGRPGGN